MKEGVLAIGGDNCIIRINDAAIQFFRLKSPNIEKKPYEEVIRFDDILDFIRDSLKDGAQLCRDIYIKNGTYLILRLTSAPLQISNEKSSGTLILINDITRFKKLDKVRQDFVANVSHELKTPITSIKGYVETLREGQVKDKKTVNKFLSIVARQTDRMNAIITDLLQLSQIEAQEGAELDTESQTLVAIIRTAIENSQELASEKDIEVIVEGDQQLKANVNRPLLEQAIINLLQNALKFSELHSKVRIQIVEDELELRISIIDTGCGIAPKYHSRLFERFYRVDKARSRELGGTGLGLAIVKHIAMAHNGNVSVVSGPNEGSTFTIHLPRH
jgi:two-component system phosphate regulon sensor histidine kinase PhoR